MPHSCNSCIRLGGQWDAPTEAKRSLPSIPAGLSFLDQQLGEQRGGAVDGGHRLSNQQFDGFGRVVAAHDDAGHSHEQAANQAVIQSRNVGKRGN